MIDCSEKATILYQQGIIEGIRPVFINILKGDYPFKGRYVMTFKDNALHFIKLNIFYRYAGNNKTDFSIKLENLSGYRFDYYKTYDKLFTLYFDDNSTFTFSYLANFYEAYDNEKNMNEIGKILKEAKIFQRNKEGIYGQKIISKRSQRFTQEVRRITKK